MSYMRVINLCCFILFLFGTAVKGKVVLPAVIDNNMVLQQKSEVALWGKAKSNSKIKITTSWNKRSYVTQANGDSLWRVMVSTPEAGGPFAITFDDGEKLVLNNILIGEVWICSGQSNMSMPVIGLKNQPIAGANDFLLDADNPKIRLFQIQRQYSLRPEFDCKASPWIEANSESVANFSAVGYFYAKILQEKLQVPVGIIQTAWGGTRIEAWTGASSLDSLHFKSQSGKSKVNQHTPSALYNAMINPIVGFGIKGFLWYQGEANRVNYHQYDRLMEAMVKGWRSVWNLGNLPFYYVQIAPFRYDGKDKSPFLREAQLKASTLIPNSGMVVSLDVGKEAFIHAPDKFTIAKRLAFWSLANDYGISKLAYASPVYKSHKITNDTVIISFANAKYGLSSFGKELSAFEVAGADKVFYPAKATIVSQGVKVQSEHVKEPIAVRYAFKDWVIGDLYNTEGLPASSFRTDNW